MSMKSKMQHEKSLNNKQKLKKNKDDSDNESILHSDSEEDDFETISDNEDSSYHPSKDGDEDDEEWDDDYYEPTKKSKSVKQSSKKQHKCDHGSDSESEMDMDQHELQKYISRIFPSKYMSERVNNSKKSKKTSEKKSSKKTDKKSKDRYNLRDKSKKQKSKKYDNNDSESIDSEDTLSDSEDEYDDFENNEEKKGFYSIILGLNGSEDEEEYQEEPDDVECNSEDEEMFMKEKYQKVEPLLLTDIDTNIDNDDDKKISHHNKNRKNKDKKDKASNSNHSKNDKSDEVELTDVEQEYLELAETKKTLVEQLNKKPKSKVLKNAVEDCNASIKQLIKKARIKNAKAYHKLIHNNKNRTNEIEYFKKKLSNKEQLRVMHDLKEINKHMNIEKPYRLTLLDTNMPAKFKAIALQKLNILRNMEPGDNEYYKIKNWVDTFMRIPFGIYKNLSVKMEDGMDVCNAFMENAKKTLNECTYGLEDAKMQIMQFLGQWISNPGAMGSAIAIHGKPGTGKTSIVKEGISKILGREFTFIALGGAGDSSFLEGHSYTYEGSSWGKIVQILIDSKCMNPIIYFDELDKVSETPRGEEIIGVLTHLTDTSQNSQFHDKYFSEIDFDLSKCLFIFSYNDENKVNPILRDRMYTISTKGYEMKEKVIIARNYLLPKIREQVNFAEGDIIIPDDTIQYIIGNTTLTKEECGVRNLKRCLEIIHTKLNLFRLIKPDSELFHKDMNMNVTFPFTVTRKTVDILIKNEEKQNQSLLAMYV